MSATASTARKRGSGISTIPAPPPNGAVVDRAPGVAGPGTQVVHPDVERARVHGAAEDGCAAVARDQIGEDGEDVDPHGVGARALGGMSTSLEDCRPPRPGRGGVTKLAGMSPPESSTSRSLAGLASTAATRPSSAPWASRTWRRRARAPRASRARLERLGLQVRRRAGARRRRGRPRPRSAPRRKGTIAGPPMKRDRRERTAGGGQGRARVQSPASGHSRGAPRPRPLRPWARPIRPT